VVALSTCPTDEEEQRCRTFLSLLLTYISQFKWTPDYGCLPYHAPPSLTNSAFDLTARKSISQLSITAMLLAARSRSLRHSPPSIYATKHDPRPDHTFCTQNNTVANIQEEYAAS